MVKQLLALIFANPGTMWTAESIWGVKRKGRELHRDTKQMAPINITTFLLSYSCTDRWGEERRGEGNRTGHRKSKRVLATNSKLHVNVVPSGINTPLYMCVTLPVTRDELVPLSLVFAAGEIERVEPRRHGKEEKINLLLRFQIWPLGRRDSRARRQKGRRAVSPNAACAVWTKAGGENIIRHSNDKSRPISCHSKHIHTEVPLTTWDKGKKNSLYSKAVQIKVKIISKLPV